MRAQPDRPRPPRPRVRVQRVRVLLIAIVALAIVALSSLRGLAGFYTDYLWFDQLGFASVWRGVLGTKILLGTVFTLGFFVVLWVNLAIADRLAPKFRAYSPEDELLERYRAVVGPRVLLFRTAVAAVFALIAGPVMAGQWNDWVLFRNAEDFGTEDAQFKRDVGFYVFRLPFLSGLVSWLFTALVVIAIVTAAAHYLNGGIRVQAARDRVTGAVKAHLSVLLGLIALTRAAGYWLNRFELNFSRRGYVDGAGYTDVNAQLPALNLLVIISIAAFLLFVVNIWLRGWVLPVLAVGLWAFVSVVVGSIYPRFVQAVRVKPSESVKEAKYIGRNIEATRTAFGLDKVVKRDFAYSQDLTAADLEKNAETIRNIRLWDPDPEIVQQTIQKLQEIRPYFAFEDVDIDRYDIAGRATQVIIAARELDQDGLTRPSWVSRHLQYTHGYGLVVAPTNASTESGQPDFTLKDLPVRGAPEVEQPRIYFGSGNPGYSIVRTDTKEIDFVRADNRNQEATYDGTGGVKIGSPLRRLAFFLRFGDPNALISNLIKSDSRILYVRNVRDRASKAAPFLRFDSDEYPVILDGRVLWVLDAYTTTTRYPYSQSASDEGLRLRSGLRQDFNYVRNSVKVVVDAYDGSTWFFVVDDQDPIARAYKSAFPKLLRDGSEVDRLFPGLRSHFRYPEDLFQVQTNMFGQYHVTDPAQFYSRTDAWDISQDPGTGLASQGVETRAVTDPSTGRVVGTREVRMEPYYLQIKLPGDDKETFQLLQNFVPFSSGERQRNLTSFMVAKSDPENYGKLEAFVMPRQGQIFGPSLAASTMVNEPTVANQVTLLDQRGSQVLYGNVQLIPIEQSLLYVRPLYVQAERTQLPELKRVIVLHGDEVRMSETLRGALTDLFGDAPETLEAERPAGTGTTGTGTSGTGTGATTTTRPRATTTTLAPSGTVPAGATVGDLLEQASAAYDEAQAALKAGDLATYQRKVDEVGRLVAAATRATGTVTTTTVAAATSTSAPAATTVPTATETVPATTVPAG